MLESIVHSDNEENKYETPGDELKCLGMHI